MFFRRTALSIVFSSIFLTACGKDEGPLPPLAYVPADTPYVMAAIEPMPEAFMDAWIEGTDPIMGAYVEFFDGMVRKMEEDGEVDPQAIALLQGLKAELSGKTVRQMMQDWGLSLAPRSAVYGMDLIPVVRLEIADEAKLRQTVARLEKAAGTSLSTAKVDDIEYWYLQPADKPLRGVLAVQGGHLVLSFTPADADETLMRQVLGLELPKQSLADTEALTAFNKRFGYTPYGSGWLSSARVLELILEPRSGYQAAYLEALDIQPNEQEWPEGCLDEARTIAKHWPGFAIGYTEFSGSGYRMRTVLETPPTVATDLKTLLAPTPGLDLASGMGFSVALKADALPPLATKWTNDLQAATQGWKCVALTLPLALASTKTSESLNNPALFMIGPMLHSVNMQFNRLELPKAGADGEMADQPPEFEGKVLIGSPNPQGLLASARSFVPELAELRLEDGADPVALPALPNSPVEMATFAAVDKGALGIAIGDAERDGLKAALAPGRSQPILQFNYRGDFYADFLRKVMTQLPVEEDREQTELTLRLMDASARMIERSSFELGVSDQGIDIIVEMRVKKR